MKNIKNNVFPLCLLAPFSRDMLVVTNPNDFILSVRVNTRRFADSYQNI